MRNFCYCSLGLISNKLEMQTLILKLILRSNEKYSRISDLKGDDLDEKGAFCQG